MSVCVCVVSRDSFREHLKTGAVDEMTVEYEAPVEKDPLYEALKSKCTSLLTSMMIGTDKIFLV